MSTNVQPEEVQAILDAMRPTPGPEVQPAEVEQRDFSRPNRISREERTALRERLAVVGRDIERALAPFLQRSWNVAIEDVSEVHSETSLSTLAPPLAALRFEARGQVCWVLWESAAAVAALELALGAQDVQSPHARRLSSVERTLLMRVLTTVLRESAKAVGIETSNPRVVETIEELGTWRDAPANADPSRLALHWVFDGPASRSAMRVLLPLTLAASGTKARKVPAKLPPHLAEIPIELSARLGASDVALADLLALEIGDVIPLGTSAERGVTLWVAESPCAGARLGSHDGKLAVRLTSSTPVPDNES